MSKYLSMWQTIKRNYFDYQSLLQSYSSSFSIVLEWHATSWQMIHLNIEHTKYLHTQLPFTKKIQFSQRKYVCGHQILQPCTLICLFISIIIINHTKHNPLCSFHISEGAPQWSKNQQPSFGQNHCYPYH